MLILSCFLSPRFLTNEADVWTQNAWDHVPPPGDQAESIAISLAKQRSAPVPDEDKQKYNATPARHWYGKLNHARDGAHPVSGTISTRQMPVISSRTENGICSCCVYDSVHL